MAKPKPSDLPKAANGLRDVQEQMKRDFLLEDCPACGGMGVEPGQEDYSCSSCGGDCFVRVKTPSVPNGNVSSNATGVSTNE